ncbi:DsbA family oxidoreductase [Hyalangium rubrum]|uniref:DsbA family oxidoreductase n=1 Tax=Hyalangium rubrum TaxID=3103134 RepID=A0ABU5HHL4_9BACT|nr:DsbA family oxidoreductase [Hyalangium sp. s54d21]MDY7232726.1 DsbA family oxidoreductase [Hyalangium sp. s54d21]
MRVEIWTDIVCPWCGLGYHRLEQALARFGHEGEVELVHRSFQLDESARVGVTERVRDMLKSKLGLSDTQVVDMTRRIEQMAQADGLTPYNVLKNRVGNTSLAHEFAAWATELGKGKEVWRLLYKTYFAEARSIFDVDSLAPLATQLGLDATAAREAMTSRRYAGKVIADGREARSLGSGGVPFVVIDRKYGVSGAQPVEVLLEALETAWREKNPQKLVSVAGQSDAGICGPDGCEVPERP